ncbi:ribonuclease R [Desulfitispora alkaliphila]|uniref:ribonuclease R n=1 Tax=Desulfitispora alkaliphila TaxID=622674 RepID=UPI003D236AFD
MAEREEIFAFMREVAYKPLTAEEFVEAMELEDTEQIGEFLKLLAEMEKRGDVILTRKKKYGLPEKMGLVVGRLQGHNKGFGFLIPDNAEEQDVYIALEDSNGAMHNDRIMVRLNRKQGKDNRREGEVIRILERANKQVVGSFEQNGNFGFVVPDDQRIYQDIYIPKGEIGGANSGDKVVAEITKWPESRRNPEGKVTMVLGKAGDPGVDILAIIKKYKLPEDFPQEVMEEVNQISFEPAPEAYENRKDLRDVQMVTIDGEDAKDLDDAVNVKVLENGNYSLGVHIADVSYYVEPGSELDNEAYKRGNSVYLVDRVIPMLPSKLSNGICSLNSGEDRMAVSCQMEIDQKGQVVNYEIFPSVIHIDRRMTYTAVKKILVDKDKEVREEYGELVESFEMMEQLALILKQRRINRGAIDFEFPESKVKLDDQGKAAEIIKVERSIAEKIIEEFMLVANETVAEHIYWLDKPGIYRVHEEPDEGKVETLNEFMHNFGYHIKGVGNEIHPKSYQEIVEKVAGRPQERIINTVMLRSMMHARYASTCLGHFGLAAKYYTHFTSPIRRYSDLIVHRVLRESWENKEARGKMPTWFKKMDNFADQTSIRERVAEEAERESVDMKKVEFMERHLGEKFDGIISSVLPFGMFIELDNSVEGLVHVSAMADDYYEFVEELMAFVGQHTNKIYKLGDRVEIQVVKVDKEARQIDFELV